MKDTIKKLDVSMFRRKDLPVSDFGQGKIHKLANEQSTMSEIEFQALKSDIELNGQLVPILVYRGKIVDGRHRWRALDELGVEKIKCWILPNNQPIDAVREIVTSMENRRHASKTQKAIRAWKMWKNSGGVTQQEAAAKFGVSYKLIREVEQLYKLRGEELIDKLFEGLKYRLISGRTTDSLPAIVKDVKQRIAEEVTHPLEEEGDSDSALLEREKFEFIEGVTKRLINELGGESSEVIKQVVNRLYAFLEQKTEEEKRLQGAYGGLGKMKQASRNKQ